MDKKTLRRLAKLDALEAGGVDNWEYYDDSLDSWYQENEKEEQAEAFLDDLIAIICTECAIYEPSGRGVGYTIESTDPVLEYILENVERFKKYD